MQCTHCGSKNYINNGSYKGVKRYKCKECVIYFSDKVRKFTYKDKERFLQLYLNNVGVNKAALFMDCSPSLIVRWIILLASIVELNAILKPWKCLIIPYSSSLINIPQ